MKYYLRRTWTNLEDMRRTASASGSLDIFVSLVSTDHEMKETLSEKSASEYYYNRSDDKQESHENMAFRTKRNYNSISEDDMCGADTIYLEKRFLLLIKTTPGELRREVLDYLTGVKNSYDCRRS